jgi:anti-anti-sigma factor
MGMKRLVLEFERRTDGNMILRLRGRLERGTASLLDGVLQALWDDPAPLVLDLAGVDHIDSRGLDVLLGAEAEAHRRDAPVDVVGVRQSLMAHRSP